MKKRLLLLISGVASLAPAHGQEPARKALVGAYGTVTEKGMAVDSIMAGSTYAVLGVQKGDTLLTLNGQPVSQAPLYHRQANALRAGAAVSITYRRDGKVISRTGTAPMRPYDTRSDGEVVYGWEYMGACQLRTIVRKPQGDGPMPAILLIPGYTCSSVESYSSGFTGKLVDTWIRAGFAVVTIEKTGMGDSYGCTDCADADLATDISVFDAGYRYMQALPCADKNNLFIWGHSMGGVIAPLVAERYQPRGVVAFATVFRPWSEFLLEMHRVQAPLDGKSYGETEDFVRLMQKVYYEFFRLKKSPEELYRNPEYKEIVASELEYKPGARHMWGRHWRFWMQLDSVDLARSWANVNCPVLSAFGGADYIACSRMEHELIARAVNSTHPGHATYLEVPDVDHLLTRNNDWVSAHKHIADAAYREANFHQGFADKLTAWMQSQLKR